MNILKVLGVLSIATSTVFAAPGSGFFVGAEIGRARLKNDGFTVYNPLASPSPEALPALDKTNNVSVARLTVGYSFTEEWGLRLSYTGFGEAEVRVAAPVYPGMVFVIPPDTYPRNVVRYKTSMFTLLPVYSIPLGDRLRLSGGIGLNYATTKSHFETTRVQYLIGTRYDSFAEDTEHKLGLALQFGVDYFVIENLSLRVTANYADAKANVPPAPMWGRSAADFGIKAMSVQFAVAWHF